MTTAGSAGGATNGLLPPNGGSAAGILVVVVVVAFNDGDHYPYSGHCLQSNSTPNQCLHRGCSPAWQASRSGDCLGRKLTGHHSTMSTFSHKYNRRHGKLYPRTRLLMFLWPLLNYELRCRHRRPSVLQCRCGSGRNTAV